MKPFKRISIIFMISGGAFFLVGLAACLAAFLIGGCMLCTSAGKIFYYTGNALKTTGRVTEHIDPEIDQQQTTIMYYAQGPYDFPFKLTVKGRYEEFQKGVEMDVYYNCKNPSECVIPAVDKVGNSALAISCVLTGIGVGFAAVLYFVAGAVLLSIYKKKSAAAQ